MVKHHGLIIVVAVWILPFEQDPSSRFQIIRCCCVVPIPEVSHYRRGLSGISELGGLLILRHHIDRKQLLHSTRIWVLLWASFTIQYASHEVINSHNQFQGTTRYNRLLLWVPLWSLLRNMRPITSHIPIQGASYFISIVAVCSLCRTHQPGR
jgi:hypothetical protein